MSGKTEVASPASKSGDEDKFGNVSSGQAAAQLFARSQAEAPTPEPTAVEDEAPGEPEKTEPSTAEVETSPAENSPEEPDTAETEESPVAEETEGEEEGVLSHKSPLDKKLRGEIQERINKEVSKRKSLEEKVLELEAEVRRKEDVKTSPAEAPMPQGPLPLSEFNDLPSLEKHGDHAKKAARWARDQLDRDDFTDEGIQINGEVYDKPRLKAIIRAAEVALEDEIPARKTFLRQRSEMSQQAVTLFPFLQDKSSPDYQLAVAAYRENPWLRERPNADYIVGLVIEGKKAVEARVAAKSSPVAKPKAPPVAKPAGDQTAVSSGAPTNRGASGSTARAAMAAERGEFMKKGAISASEAVAFLLHREKLTKR